MPSKRNKCRISKRNNPKVEYLGMIADHVTPKGNEDGWSYALSGAFSHGGGTNLPVYKEDGVYIVRRMTPLECERVQGFPEYMEMNVAEMTKDEYIAFCIATGGIIVDPNTGDIYATRGGGGRTLDKPVKLKGTNVNGYRAYSLRNGDVKKQCRGHRIVWIASHGLIPEGYVIDHINNDKQDNRLCNLQLLTPTKNSQKAKADGRYRSGENNPANKLKDTDKMEIVRLYETGEYTMRQLAEVYGVSKSRIGQLCKVRGWTDIPDTEIDGRIVKASDSARYKALGNSLALPQWWWIICKMEKFLPEKPTLGSLFDGIGGFPLVWETKYGKGAARWASEIEAFPIAVTSYHFKED